MIQSSVIEEENYGMEKKSALLPPELHLLD